MGLSAGLDFESKLFVKPDAPELLERELSAPRYSPRVIAIGTNTDPYQPIERQYEVMRGILEVLDRANHPVGIVTKSALVLARHRHPRPHGAAQPGEGRALGDHASTEARPHDGAARRDAAAPARRASGSSPRPAFRRR